MQRLLVLANQHYFILGGFIVLICDSDGQSTLSGALIEGRNAFSHIVLGLFFGARVERG